MNDPWQILILDRHTATEKDVKAAYARLLKQHRPDSDPEGFRRVREAYEAALDWLRNRAASYSLPEVSYAADPAVAAGDAQAGHGKDGPDGSCLELPVVFEDFPLPADAQEALAEVEQAAQSGNVEQVEAALVGFHERCEAGGVSGMSRATALERAFQGRVNDLASAVSNRFLIRMAELGQTNLSHLVVSAWQEAEDRGRLVQFGRALMEHARALATPEGAILLARVGVLTGLEQPEMASTLANAAYPYLPVDARNHLMAQLEQEAALGKLFADVSPSMKPFWFKRLREQGEEGFDWNSPEARKALNDVIDSNRYVWEGWGVVRQLMPAADWALVEHRLNSQVQQVANSRPRSSGFPGWIIVPVILIIINVLRFMGNDNSSTHAYSDSASRSTSATWTTPPLQKDLSTDWSHATSVKDILERKIGPQNPVPTQVPEGRRRVPVSSSSVPSAARPVGPVSPVTPLPDLRDGEAGSRQFEDFLKNGTLPPTSPATLPPSGPIFGTP